MSGALGKHVANPSDIPSGLHWAILVWETVNVHTGWERSGESGSPELYTRYYVFEAQSAWEDALVQLAQEAHATYSQRRFVGIRVEGKAKLETKVIVDVKVMR